MPPTPAHGPTRARGGFVPGMGRKGHKGNKRSSKKNSRY